MTAPRRWFRFAFSLRTLFVVVTIICSWLGWELHVVRQRQAALRRLRSQNASIGTGEHVKKALVVGVYRQHPDWPRKSFSVPFVRRLLGDEPIIAILVANREALDEVQRLFPEAFVGIEAKDDAPPAAQVGQP